MRLFPDDLVIDASVGIRLFIPQDYSALVQDLLDDALSDIDRSVHVPDLFFVECANILWKAVRWSAYPQEEAERNLRRIGALALQVTPTRDLVGKALTIACIYDITAYDACYVALAEMRRTPLLTADNRLVTALSNSPFRIILLGA